MLIATSAVAEEITIGSATFTGTIPETISESKVEWSQARNPTKQVTAQITNVTAIVGLQAAASELTKRYDAELNKLAQKENVDVADIASMFQLNEGGKEYPKLQTLHDAILGLNHLLDQINNGNLKKK